MPGDRLGVGGAGVAQELYSRSPSGPGTWVEGAGSCGLSLISSLSRNCGLWLGPAALQVWRESGMRERGTRANLYCEMVKSNWLEYLGANPDSSKFGLSALGKSFNVPVPRFSSL